METVRPVRLSSAKESAAAAPYTFLIPHDVETAALRAGDLVKLRFEWDAPIEKYEAERMWVIVRSVGPDMIAGDLDNNPYEKGKMEAGERVLFHRDNILSIQWADPPPDIDMPPSREYWDRCFVEDCVLDGTEPVGFLYREEPLPKDEGEKFPDSGWRIRGRQGIATKEEMDARTYSFVALGAVLNMDDSWLHLIDSPVGAGFLRNFETGAYDPE